MDRELGIYFVGLLLVGVCAFAMGYHTARGDAAVNAYAERVASYGIEQLR